MSTLASFPAPPRSCSRSGWLGPRPRSTQSTGGLRSPLVVAATSFLPAKCTEPPPAAGGAVLPRMTAIRGGTGIGPGRHGGRPRKIPVPPHRLCNRPVPLPAEAGVWGARAAPRAVLPRMTAIRGGTGISWGRPPCRPGPIPVPPLIVPKSGSTAPGAARAPRPPPQLAPWRGAVLPRL